MFNLMATLNQINNEDHIIEILKSKSISSVRFNTGVRMSLNKKHALLRLKKLCDYYGKELWIDIKGRQIRIIEWANPLYESIKVNHILDLRCKGQLKLRNDDDEIYEIESVNKNEIFLKQKPRKTVGAGQSINILAENYNEFKIRGYLTKEDKECLKICKELEINNIMASYVESYSDINEIKVIHYKARIKCKIESKKGIDFINSLNKKNKIEIVAARDDLYNEINEDTDIYEVLKNILLKDNKAICASKLFTSLMYKKNIEMSDISDLKLMIEYGYKNFMLCDNISEYYFEKALETWNKVIEKY